MTDFEFWQTIYRAVMMVASAIQRRYLTKTPTGQRIISDSQGVVIVIPGYDIDTAPEKV